MSKYLSIYSLIIVLLTMVSCESSDNTPKLNSNEEKSAYIQKGKQIAKATFVTLSEELKIQVKKGGIHEAINYCNVNAFPLTDSISQANNVVIRRVTGKMRNQSNAPDAIESQQIADYQEQMKMGVQLKPVVVEVDGNARFMAPITLKPMCLNCHGTPIKHISKSDLAEIRELYPEDKAINYKAGDLRGIWSITFLE